MAKVKGKAGTSRRRGRPSVGERVPLGLRVTPDIKQRLDDAAEESGRSQSQEAEFRLERSFDRTSLAPEVLSLAFNPRTAGILLMIGMVMEDAGGLYMDATRKVDYSTDIHWSDHSIAFEFALLATISLLIGARPPTWDAEPPRLPPRVATSLRSIAATIVADVRGDEIPPALRAPPWCDAGTLRKLLDSGFVARLRKLKPAEVDGIQRLIADLLNDPAKRDKEERSS